MTDTTAAARPVRRSRRGTAWLGLVPFFAFLLLFLLIPAVSIFINSFKNETGGFSLDSMKEAFQGQNFQAFWFSVKFSFGAALVGAVLGTVVAYAAASVTRPKWLRTVVTSFSGVAANMGGLPLAFAFITLLGARAGVLTNVLKWFGWDIYANDFDLGNPTGLHRQSMPGHPP